MSRGQPPKHPNLRVIQGNPGKRPIPSAGPTVDGKLKRPKYLEGRAAAIWNEYARLATWLTAADSHLLAVWCQLAAEIETQGADMPTSRISVWRALSGDLGFTITSRLRLPATPAPDPDDPAARFFE